MSRKARWKQETVKNGYLEVQLTSWKYFHDFIRQEFLDFPSYVWRGQREGKWSLESSLDRALKGTPVGGRAKAIEAHLERFKLASRGRRGPNPQKIEAENEWWALAQHNGMATPLLDWTASPFVALYFAFEDETVPETGNRAVWSVGGGRIQQINKELQEAHEEKGHGGQAATLAYVRPAQDENARLVAQAGIFTRAPEGTTVDRWIKDNIEDNQGGNSIINLTKILIPNVDRPECLRALNRMNINHLSLFPDLFGAGVHCNNVLRIKKY